MIVGLIGYEGVGKSQVAKRLRDKHGFKLVSFSDPLKELGVALGFTREQMWGPSSARNTPHPYLKDSDGNLLLARVFLDRVGMCIRGMSPDALAESVRNVTGDVANESTRFVNEAIAIKRAGGRLIRRSGGAPNGLDTDAEVDAIPAELIDATIPWCESKEQLHEIVDIIVDGWMSEST